MFLSCLIVSELDVSEPDVHFGLHGLPLGPLLLRLRVIAVLAHFKSEIFNFTLLEMLFESKNILCAKSKKERVKCLLGAGVKSLNDSMDNLFLHSVHDEVLYPVNDEVLYPVLGLDHDD